MFDNGSRKLIREELFTVEDECTVVATRKQIPLDLAYAMTIHKSQGMAFPFLDVDLSTVFEAGQAYVAVSRATTIHGLKVSSYRERMPQVSQLVIDFYANGVVMTSAGHFLRIRQWGGQLQKGTILYQVWRNDRWLLVTKILVWYGI